MNIDREMDSIFNFLIKIAEDKEKEPTSIKHSHPEYDSHIHVHIKEGKPYIISHKVRLTKEEVARAKNRDASFLVGPFERAYKHVYELANSPHFPESARENMRRYGKALEIGHYIAGNIAKEFKTIDRDIEEKNPYIKKDNKGYYADMYEFMGKGLHMASPKDFENIDKMHEKLQKIKKQEKKNE